MKKTKVILLLSAALSCVVFAGCSKSRNTTSGAAPISTDTAGPVELKLKWTPGKSYDQEMTMDQKIHLTLPGMSQPMDQITQMTEDYSLEALKALPDGGAQMQMDITGIKMMNKLGAKVQVNFDSSNDLAQDGKDPIAPIFRKVVGAQLKYEVDDAGKVNEVAGLPEFIQQISGGNPQAAQLVKSSFSQDMIKQMISRGEGLPPHPVQVGDQWPLHMELTSGQAGVVELDMKYTFRGWQQHDGRKCALDEFVGTMNTKPGSSSGPMNVSIDNGTIEGSTWFDPDMGTVVDTSMIDTMNLKLAIQGKQIDAPMKQTMIVKLKGITDVTPN